MKCCLKTKNCCLKTLTKHLFTVHFFIVHMLWYIIYVTRCCSCHRALVLKKKKKKRKEKKEKERNIDEDMRSANHAFQTHPKYPKNQAARPRLKRQDLIEI